MKTKYNRYIVWANQETDKEVEKIAKELNIKKGDAVHRLLKLSIFFGLHNEMLDDSATIKEVIGD